MGRFLLLNKLDMRLHQLHNSIDSMTLRILQLPNSTLLVWSCSPQVPKTAGGLGKQITALGYLPISTYIVSRCPSIRASGPFIPAPAPAPAPASAARRRSTEPATIPHKCDWNINKPARGQTGGIITPKYDLAEMPQLQEAPITV